MDITPLKMSFRLKRKSGVDDLFTIFFRIRLAKTVAEISLKYDLPESLWDENQQCIRHYHKDYHYVQSLMDQLRAKAMEIQRDSLVKGRSVDANQIKDRILGQNMGNSHEPTFLSVFDKVINRKKIIGGTKNTPATIQKYKRCRTHLANFMKHQFNQEDIRLDKLNLEFIELFECYMRATAKCENNTTMKYIQNVRTIFKYAHAHGLAFGDPFAGFKIKIRQVDRTFLTEDEINRLINYNFPTSHLKDVCLCFVFCCFTGLAHIDVKSLKLQHIIRENGRYWIRTKRQKTHVTTNVPLLDVPLKILKAVHPDLDVVQRDIPAIRVISNQKTNEALKEIARLTNIEKVLTFHIARHTFATTVTLSNGVPIESVSKMLGHTKISTTQHYAKLLDKKLEADMDALSARLNSLYR